MHMHFITRKEISKAKHPIFTASSNPLSPAALTVSSNDCYVKEVGTRRYPRKATSFFLFRSKSRGKGSAATSTLISLLHALIYIHTYIYAYLRFSYD